MAQTERSRQLWALLERNGAEIDLILGRLSVDLRQLLGIRVDVVAADVLRDPVAASAAQSFIPLP